MGGALHFLHYCISKIAWKTVEDGVFGENDGLGVSSIHNFDFQEAFLDELEHG